MKVLWSLLVIVAHVMGTRDSFQWFRSRADCKDVVTEAGMVRGCVSASGEYLEFLGVPYAAPPTGQDRFKAPIPLYSWNGVYEADSIIKCPQNGDGVEDCLVLNIFTPVRSMFDEPVPVLVYFHGGSFLMGAGQVEGVQGLIKQNIIVVTVNYRLGALGFLCLGIDEAPGNAGLKDQVAALQWIQRNIESFGGDPNKVTIYGMSAGGASVELLVLSPRGRGLFQQAIVESGTATGVWALDHNPIQTALNAASYLRIPKITSNKYLASTLASYYKRIHARRLSQVNFEYYNNLTDGTFGFVPCVEKVLNNSEPFLTEPPYEILIKEKYDKVPMMFFFAALEGLFLRSEEFYERQYTDRMSANFSAFLPADLQFDSPEIRDAIASNIKEFYFGNKTIGENVVDYLNYFGDYMILHGLLNSIEIHSRKDNPVYVMEFGYKGDLGSYEKFYDNLNVAGHGDVIKHAILNKKAKSDSDKLIVARVTKIIANFVKYGNPSPDRSRFLPMLWPPVKPGNVSCLYMDDDFQVIDEPHWDAKEFWDAIYSKYRKPFHIKHYLIPSSSL
ncbi:hypothetical protein O0L34_g1103 [Tuta absoluta]|nr:hypothetical protein O0L34_g1103 [Tuta absoluta]